MMAPLLRLFAIWLTLSASVNAQVPQTRVCIVNTGNCFTRLAQALAAVRDGQTIILQPGRYDRDVGVLRANGVTLRVGGDGQTRAHLNARGLVAEGKAILVIKGNNTTIDGIAFTGARAEGNNGAGIRHEGGNLTIRNSVFDDNEMGLLTGDHASASISIIDTEFARSSRAPGPDDDLRRYPAHNIYVGRVERLTLRGVWSHSADIGHALKSRARNNDIEASYFSTRTTTGSYELEFPSGGTVRVVGNIIEQGRHSDNIAMLSYGAEIARYPNGAPQSLSILHNTFVNHNTVLGRMVRAHGDPPTDLRGNVWIGPGSPSSDGNLGLWSSELRDYAHCDFRPTTLHLTNDSGFAPATRYVHPNRHTARTDHEYGAIPFNSEVAALCTNVDAP